MSWLRRNRPVENVRRSGKQVPVKRPKPWLKWVTRMMAVALVLGAVGAGLWRLNHSMTVTHWEVQAPPAIKTAIRAYMRKQPALDFWHSRASLIQQALLAEIPDIRRVEVSRMLPDGLHIAAEARVPVAIWANAEKVLMLVDEDGQAYRPLRRGEALDLPVLRLPQTHLVEAAALLRRLSVAAGGRVQSLSEVIVSDDDWRLNFAKGEQWQLNHRSMAEDLPMVLEILNKPRWASGHWRMDARIPERWFIRPAKQEVI